MFSAPSIAFIKKAMQTYARQGGTSNIFINDDGIRVILPAPCKRRIWTRIDFGQTLPDQERERRIAFYEANGIGWVARPADGEPSENGDGTTFVRAGRFKKASNMNYALALSRKAEQRLNEMIASGETALGTSARVSLSGDGSGSSEDERAIPASLEERALMRAVEEIWEQSGKRWRPWAKNGRACRVGKIVLLVDSDTVVPEVGFFELHFKSSFIDRPLLQDCLRDAAREMAECPTVAIIQHESGEISSQSEYWATPTTA